MFSLGPSLTSPRQSFNRGDGVGRAGELLRNVGPWPTAPIQPSGGSGRDHGENRLESDSARHEANDRSVVRIDPGAARDRGSGAYPAQGHSLNPQSYRVYDWRSIVRVRLGGRSEGPPIRGRPSSGPGPEGIGAGNARTVKAAPIEGHMGRLQPLIFGAVTGALILGFGISTGQVVPMVAGVAIILPVAVFAQVSTA